MSQPQRPTESRASMVIYAGLILVVGLIWFGVAREFYRAFQAFESEAGTVARCKAAGFVSGAVFRATDADCLDTRVMNEFNSQISDANVRPGAAIQGNKMDGIIASLNSTGQFILGVRSLLIPGALVSTQGPVTFAMPHIVLSSLASVGGLISMGGAGVATPTLVLQSIYAGGSAANPPPVGAVYANTVVRGQACMSAGLSTAAYPDLIASFNLSVRRDATGEYEVFFNQDLTTDSYVAVATNLASTLTALWAQVKDVGGSASFGVDTRSSAGLIDSGFCVVVFGR